MKISLTPELEQLIHEHVASGQYTTPSDVITAALQLLKQQSAPTPKPPITILQRMGGQPRYLLHQGGLSERGNRRQLLTQRLQQRYRAAQ